MRIECPANVRLQEYLLSRDIHILTACGGRGNCAKCEVRIVAGEAAVNTMDRLWFTPAQLAEGWRLGCQVYAVGPLTVEIPSTRAAD
jgi:Na+-transporting NADH:ubiquinone oxidoreductase subunit F